MNSQMDENLIKWLATSPDSLESVLKLTDPQKELGMSKPIIFMANVVLNFSSFSDTLGEEAQKRFARFQLLYQKHFRTQQPLQLLHLSPRMAIAKDAERILLKKVCEDHLESCAREAEESLESTLVREESKLRKQEQRRILRRQKKRSKNQEELEKHALEDSGGPEKEATSIEPELNAISMEQDVTKDGTTCASDTLNPLGTSIEEQHDRVFPVSPTKDRSNNPVVPKSYLQAAILLTPSEKEKVDAHLRAQRREHLEMMQQVQLKAFIAETQAAAALERVGYMENMLIDLLLPRVVEKVLDSEIKEYISVVIAQEKDQYISAEWLKIE